GGSRGTIAGCGFDTTPSASISPGVSHCGPQLTLTGDSPCGDSGSYTPEARSGVMRTTMIALSLTVGSVIAQSSPPYLITHTYTLGGDGGWDYIVPDPPNHRLFIARQNRVMVVDADNGSLLGEITGINGAHGIAVARLRSHGFATSGNDRSVVMFDLKTFEVLGRIPAAEDADAIIYDPASNRVFTFNGDAHSSTVIDPTAGTLITNVPLGGKPEYGVSASDGKVYANL